MEIRYLGFEQQENSRAYRFEVLQKGRQARRFVVKADLSLFLAYHVGIQEGPTLSASKLTSDLDKHLEGVHELTGDDLRSHADARILAEAQRAEMRKAGRRRHVAAGSHADEQSAWRNFGLGKPSSAAGGTGH